MSKVQLLVDNYRFAALAYTQFREYGGTVAEYLVYELQEDGTARRSPTMLTAENDAAAYIEASRIASPEDWVVEVWLGPLLIWHLEPSPGKRPRGIGSLVETLVGDIDSDFCQSAA